MSGAAPLPLSIAGVPPQAWIAQPAPFYLTGEEELQLTSLANVAGVTLTIAGRILRPDNTISRIAFTHAPNSNRTTATKIVPLSEGWLLGLTVRATAGTPPFGSVWVAFDLLLGQSNATQVMQTLGAGFCTTNTPFQLPFGVNMLPLDGPGNLRSITGTTPGAGAEISETVPTGARWEPLAFRFQLATSATVANRGKILTFDDGANEYHRVESNANQAASSTFFYAHAQGHSAGSTGVGATVMNHLPGNFRMGAGHRIRTSTGGIQVGDQYSAVQYLVREWLTAE
jgi:hypothetical protein